MGCIFQKTTLRCILPIFIYLLPNKVNMVEYYYKSLYPNQISFLKFFKIRYFQRFVFAVIKQWQPFINGCRKKINFTEFTIWLLIVSCAKNQGEEIVGKTKQIIKYMELLMSR